MIRPESILPITLAIIDLCAGAVYAYKGDWARAWYWIAACQITGSTLWIGK